MSVGLAVLLGFSVVVALLISYKKGFETGGRFTIGMLVSEGAITRDQLVELRNRAQKEYDAAKARRDNRL